MATLTSRRETERHQLRQKHVEAATQQQLLGQQQQQQQQQQVQKQPSPPPSANDRVQWSPPPSYSQSSYSPILRDNIYQHLTQAEQVIFERGLDDYEQRKNLVGFVECLRVILNTNQKRQLIFAIREYAVRSSDYKKFNKLLVNYGIAASVASAHSQPKPVKKKSDLATSGVHKIEIKKDLNGDWGFNIRGGSEHGVGIFVSWVNPGSDATLKGLKVGDQILKANDVNFEGISHQAAVQIMSSVKKLRLFVLSKGVVPHTQVNPQKSFVWVDVTGQSCTPPMTRHGRRGFQSEADERKITLVVEPGKQLGISIRGGSEHGLGIYISEVDEGSVADTYGLKVGDQILEVNGTSFIRILHTEAAKILKTNAMLIIVVKDVGKLPHSRATTQTQWHSSQPNSIPVNRMKHPSSEKSGFKHDIGKQVMHDQYSGHPSLTIMKDKAKSVLSESEWKTFNYYITQYKQHKLRVEDLAIALIDLLDTTEKYKLIAEIRSVIFPKDMNTFNKLTVHKEMLTRKGHYDFQEGTKFGGSENSLTSSSANSGSQDSITQNARAILDNFTLQSRDSDSAESDDGGFSSGGIQLKSYVQNSSNDNVITPERYASNTYDRSKTDTPKFFAPPPPSTPPTTSTPQSENLQDVLTDTLKERRKQLHPKDSFMDSSQDDTINASTFSDSKDIVPHIVVTGSQETLSTVIQESVRREREEKMIRDQREKERRFQEAKERHRMESDRETQENLEDKIEEIEARIKKEYEVSLEKEREKLAELQKQEIERREELDRLENERKRQSRANFQESMRSELESEIRQEYEKTLKVEKEEKEQLQFILSQQKINEEAITELEIKIREDVQRQAREEFEQALQKEREEMQKREQAERRRREEIEEAQKRMEIERLEAEEQMRIEIEERVAKEAEERARLEYEERLQRETAERARLAEEIKTHKEIEERLEQQIQQQKEEMEKQIVIALEKERAEELIEKDRAAENEMKKAAEQEQRQKEVQRKRDQEAAEQKREEEQRKREREAAEQKRREEEQRNREREAAEQKREEEQRKREREAAGQKRREEEQRNREREAAEQKREEQRKREKEAAEQKRREEEQRSREREAAEQKREEQRKREREAAEQKRREEEQRKREREAAEQKRREEEQRKKEDEEAEQKRREEIEAQQLEQLLLLDTNDFGSLQQSNTKKNTSTAIADKDMAIQEDRERAEKMLQQRMLMTKQKGASKATSASKEGGMSYAKQAGVVGKKGFSYAGYTGLTGDMITVTITKVTKRLGIAVNGGAETRQVAVRIKEIIPGESAALTGQGLRVGQQILQVNNTSMKGLKHKDAVMAIKNAFINAEKTMSIIVLDPDDED